MTSTDRDTLFVIAEQYIKRGAALRTMAIPALLEYIEAGGYNSKTQKGKFLIDGVEISHKKYALSCECFRLAKMYEAEHEFELAIEMYRKAARIQRTWHVPIIGVADCYRKMNQLKKAIKLLEKECKNTAFQAYSFVDEWGMSHTASDRTALFRKSLDDLYKKLDNGYVFKSKKK